MTKEDKAKQIRRWIDSAERSTVHFRDEANLNAEVTACSEELVDFSIDTWLPCKRSPCR